MLAAKLLVIMAVNTPCPTPTALAGSAMSTNNVPTHCNPECKAPFILYRLAYLLTFILERLLSMLTLNPKIRISQICVILVLIVLYLPRGSGLAHQNLYTLVHTTL